MALGGLLLSALFWQVPHAAAAGAEIGSRVQDFRLSDQAGKSHALSQYAGRPVVLVFWSFKCPVSLAADPRLRDLAARWGGRAAVLAVASNANESPAEIARNAENLRLPVPVLHDADGALADNVGVTHTPVAVIIGGDGLLRYRGSLESLRKGGEGARAGSVEAALEQLLAGRPVPAPESRQSGCAIRRRG